MIDLRKINKYRPVDEKPLGITMYASVQTCRRCNSRFIRKTGNCLYCEDCRVLKRKQYLKKASKNRKAK